MSDHSDYLEDIEYAAMNDPDYPGAGSDTETCSEPGDADDLADFMGKVQQGAPSAEPAADVSAEPPAASSILDPPAGKKGRPETKASIMTRVDRLRLDVVAGGDALIARLPRECTSVATQLNTSRHQMNKLRRDELAQIDAEASRCRLREAIALASAATGPPRAPTEAPTETPTEAHPAAASPQSEAPTCVKVAARKTETRAAPGGARRRGGEPVGEDGLTPTQRAAIFATQTTLVLAKGLEDASQHLPGDWCLNGFAERLGEPTSRSQLAVTLEEMIRTAEPGSIFHPSSFSPEVKLAVILLAAAAPSVAKKAPATSGAPTT